MFSPIALFVYNRPEHTRLAIERLSKCKGFEESPLFVFSDGPKSLKNAAAVAEVRNLVRSTLGEHARLVEARVNHGLARSIISGVSRVCNEYGRIIVLEDDLLVSPHFLEYMNAALTKYERIENVMQVSGHMFPVDAFNERRESLFLPFTTSWGWATWKRAWDCFDTDANGWEILKTDRELKERFNLGGTFDYFKMLKMQMTGKVDSWAIRWYWSVFKANGFALFPPKSYVQNIGFDGSGTHGWRSARRMLDNADLNLGALNLPDSVVVRPEDFKAVIEGMKGMNTPQIMWIKKLLKMIA